MSTMRKIAPMNMPDITPGGADMAEPKFERANPADLLVDEGYQRNLSERSVKLIRKIVSHWDWRTFMPPVVVRTKLGMHVIDGQHTAIAAATHPKIKDIPVMVVKADEVADRARAFLGRNRDRIKPGDTLAVGTVAALFGIEIKTSWGQGYFLDAETKRRVRAMMPNIPPPVRLDGEGPSR